MPVIQIHFAYDQNLYEMYIKLNTEKYQLLNSENDKRGNDVGEDNISLTISGSFIGMSLPFVQKQKWNKYFDKDD